MNRERAETHLRLVAEAELRRATTYSQDSAPLPQDRSGGGPAALARQPHAAVAAALYGLPRWQREAIALQYYADLSEYETARTIGLSLGAVRAHTARGIAALRTALAADTSRLARVAQVLTAAGALDDGVADQIQDDFALALDIRRTGSAGQRGPDPGSLLRSSAAHLPLAMLMSCRTAAAAAAGPGTGAYRVVPVGQMIPVRGEGQGISGQMEDVSGEMYVLSYAQTVGAARLTVAAHQNPADPL